MEENIVIRNRSDFYKLFDLMKKEIPDISTAIFLEMPALEPIDVLMLTQFVIIQLRRNCEVKIVADESMQKYIAAIGLVDFIQRNVAKPETIDAIPSYSAMPIRRVERETMVEYIDATSKYFKTICGDKDLTMLDLCMAELINNVYDHSFSPIGAYVFCQFYPVKAEIKMAVSDYGIGIPGSVNHYLLNKGKDILTDIDCVKWSIKENKTTQSIPQNAGKGLDNVNTFVRRNQGSWKLWTNNVILNGRTAGNSYGANPIYGFKGTLAQISININNLGVNETVDEFNWDF